MPLVPRGRMAALGTELKCWHGSIPAAIGGYAENICEAPGDRQGVRRSAMSYSSAISSTSWST